MGLSVGCVSGKIVVSPNGGDIMQRGPYNPVWTATTDGGRRLSLVELKNSIKMPLTEKELLAVTKTWKTIGQNLTRIGCNTLIRSARHR